MSFNDFRRYECEAADCSAFEDVEHVERDGGGLLYGRHIIANMPDTWGTVVIAGAHRTVCARCRAKVEALLWPSPVYSKLVTEGPYR